MILSIVGCLYALGENQVGELGVGDVEVQKKNDKIYNSPDNNRHW